MQTKITQGKLHKTKRSGFSLLELLVTVALFTVVAVTVSSISLSLSRTREIAKQKEDVRSELRSLLDAIGREITWAVAFETGCESGCNAASKPLRYATRVRPDTPEKEIIYRSDAATLSVYKREQKTFGTCSTRPELETNPLCEQKVLSNQIKVENMQYYIVNNSFDAAGNPLKQVTITIAFKGYYDLKGQRENFSISSSFTPRFLQDQQALDTGGGGGGGGGMVTPLWKAWGQRCYTGTPSYKTYGLWIDDAKYWMHIERCNGAGCTTGFVPAIIDLNSSRLFSFIDTIPGASQGQTYGYRMRLHNHSNGLAGCGVGDPVTPTCGPYSEVKYITLSKSAWACSGTGSGGGARTTISGSGSGGGGGGSSGGSKGRGGEQ